jgi:hypothetical protein
MSQSESARQVVESFDYAVFHEEYTHSVFVDLEFVSDELITAMDEAGYELTISTVPGEDGVPLEEGTEQRACFNKP